MILGLDISTSITGATVLSMDDKILYCEAWKLNSQSKKKDMDIFAKADKVKSYLLELKSKFKIEEIYIESPLWISRGKSTAQTILTLARFNGIVSWIVWEVFGLTPHFITAIQARNAVGLKTREKSVRANIKEHVLKFILDKEPSFTYDKTKFGNPAPGTYDRADSLVVAKAGLKWSSKKR
jgi:hypothetical protein